MAPGPGPTALGFFIAAVEGPSMRRLLWIGVGGTLVAAAMVVGSILGFVSWNGLFLDSPYATAAIASLVIVAAFVIGLVVLAGPSPDWRSSPYW